MITTRGKVHTVEGMSLGQCLQIFLMSSYQYYHRYASLIEDSEFDAITRRLLESWESFDHQHKHLVSLDDLRAGTLYALPAKDYPTMVVHASEDWSREKFAQEVMSQ